jgi:hypothetical protein
MTNSLSAVSLDQLKQAIQLREQIAALEIELTGILGGAVSTPVAPTGTSVVPPRRGRPPGKRAISVVPAAPSTAPVAVRKGRGGPRKMSPEARARIAAAQKARWAKFHGSRGTVPKNALPKKGGMSPAGRARIIAGQKARWAYRQE